MLNANDSKPDRDTTEQPFDSLRLVNRLIGLLYWVIVPSVLLMVGTSIVYIYLSFTTPFGNQSGLVIDTMIDLAKVLWSAITPIVLITILGTLVKWILFSAQGTKFSSRIMGVLSDVTSLIAAIVIATVCLLPLLRISIPEALGNIALVIIGFYFGSEKKLRRGDEDDDDDNDNMKQSKAKPKPRNGS